MNRVAPFGTTSVPPAYRAVVIDDLCLRCGAVLPAGRDFDNHRCVPPRCTCWTPTAAGHQLDCDLARHRAMLARAFADRVETDVVEVDAWPPDSQLGWPSDQWTCEAIVGDLECHRTSAHVDEWHFDRRGHRTWRIRSRAVLVDAEVLTVG